MEDKSIKQPTLRERFGLALKELTEEQKGKVNMEFDQEDILIIIQKLDGGE